MCMVIDRICHRSDPVGLGFGALTFALVLKGGYTTVLARFIGPVHVNQSFGFTDLLGDFT